jgi:hypothetical protein
MLFSGLWRSKGQETPRAVRQAGTLALPALDAAPPRTETATFAMG